MEVAGNAFADQSSAAIATALGLDPDTVINNLEEGENQRGKAVKVAFLWENS